jgi:TRAP-type mannitol/chloroaromatic compound transport system permease small subunit
VKGILLFIDLVNTWVGRIAGWLILVLTFGVSYEVFVRYVLGAPTTWAYDVSYMTYGALFLLAGPYTLSRNGHVRGDMLYRTWKPRNQARLDLVLYILFFFPGVLALVYSGYNFAYLSVLFKEVSIFSPAGAPVFPLKALIPITGVLLFLQGFVESIRCIQCIQTGAWPQRLHDVEETESAIIQLKRGEKAGA